MDRKFMPDKLFIYLNQWVICIKTSVFFYLKVSSVYYHPYELKEVKAFTGKYLLKC